MRLGFVPLWGGRAHFGFSLLAIGWWKRFVGDFLCIAEEFGVGYWVRGVGKDRGRRVYQGAPCIGEYGESLADLVVKSGRCRAEGKDPLVIALVKRYCYSQLQFY